MRGKGPGGGGRRLPPKKAEPRPQRPAKKGEPRPQGPRASKKPTPEPPRTFRLGAIPGATPGRWIDTWRQRMPPVAIELVPITVADQRASLEGVDAALVRLPIADAGDLHLIRLYEEQPVVVASAESHLLAADELSPDDLAGEVLITPGDDVFAPLGLPTTPPAFGHVPTTEEAITAAASGVGIVVVPMSLARLYDRKDTGYRPLRGGPVSAVALAWPRDRTTADVETFVGIIRGRTADSSR